MDKYEEAAREWVTFIRKDHAANLSQIRYISDAFRWYDERREKEVCSCTADEVKGKGYSHCHYCGKLIPDSRPGVLVDGKIVEKGGSR